MSVAGPVWVLSPHLLVAQAVTAALRSVGVPAETRRWESVLEEDVSESSTPLRPAVVIAIVDGVDNSAVVGHVEAFAQPGDVRVVVVSSADASTRWGGLLANDAVDVVTVTTSVTQLAEVVKRLTAGASSMDPEERAALRTSWALDRDRRRHVREQLESLSPQQRRVLELLASGRRVAEVGVEMGVAEGTVRSHVKALRAKLGASTQLKAVAMFHEVYEVTGSDLVPRPRQAGEDPGDDPGDDRSRGERVGVARR
ncbi:helix-turn-helix transcriptional regulator [Nocardioides pinisoli]|uniref:LuxR C-terminal-related transcriptional regulator n=1 Tax=Nocardioides pinisoli TaxID=2950279 RepID=A0ABT1L2D3_9ACTN|nr:LuxR C-terminal-related transcriptional regulator [Nocardioides pinisoli]MCP3423006.1 LuxR C-terminal-related transcriptional regulator [Nocardioides pinisoli]